MGAMHPSGIRRKNKYPEQWQPRGVANGRFADIYGSNGWLEVH